MQERKPLPHQRWHDSHRHRRHDGNAQPPPRQSTREQMPRKNTNGCVCTHFAASWTTWGSGHSKPELAYTPSTMISRR